MTETTSPADDHWERKSAPPVVLEGDAAAERARQAWGGKVELIWRDKRGEALGWTGPLEPGTCKIGIPLEAQSVDVIPVSQRFAQVAGEDPGRESAGSA